jgi:NTP pyrophosphatase (non-canonical NTP hydrolase)
MTFNDYQQKALVTDTFDSGDRSIDSKAFFAKILGLVGESGEIAEKFKKIYRDQDGKITHEQVESLKKELGDVLWYLDVLSEYLGIPFDEIAQQNINKLHSRKKRNVIKGSGDNR